MSGLLIVGLFAVAVLAAPTTSRAATISVGISVGIAPPPIPIYTQPVCPGPAYMWTPGYWAYDPVDGYYWVPGTWVVARPLACCGRLGTGAGAELHFSGTQATGVPT